jgi:hypothetical protein
MSQDIKTLDVREDLLQGREPFDRIMAFVAELDEDEPWRLLATFRPDPLIGLMGGRGYTSEAVEWEDGTWAVTFTPAR